MLSSESGMAYIKIENVSYIIDGKGQKRRTLFQDFSLSVERQEMVAIVGANGAGKTTLTKIILGIVQPGKGHVTLDGKEISEYKRYEIGRKIGYLFQNPLLQLFNQTIEEELLFTNTVQNNVTDHVRSRYRSVLKDMSLEDILHTPVFHLSQGEKQRLAMGTLLMNEVEFMVLDEPTSGLDYERKEALRKRLIKLHREGTGMIIVTHDMDFLEGLPIRVMALRDGRLAVNG